jgi:hypothetical protein
MEKTGEQSGGVIVKGLGKSVFRSIPDNHSPDFGFFAYKTVE